MLTPTCYECGGNEIINFFKNTVWGDNGRSRDKPRDESKVKTGKEEVYGQI